MILDKTIRLKINPKLDRTYFKLGYYDINKIKDLDEIEIDVLIEHINHTNREYINVKCDICGEEKQVQIYNYWKNIKKYNIYTCSQLCAQVKNKKTNLERYGTESILGNPELREKGKQTLIEKYGVDNAMKCKEIKEKAENTLFEKYNVKVPMQNEKIKNKQHETMKDLYGSEHALQIDEFKQVVLDNFLNKSVEEKKDIIEKRENTVLENYGAKNIRQTEYLKNKINKLTILKYSKDVEIINIENKIYTIKCNCGHTIDIDYHNFYYRLNYKSEICTICNPLNSKKSGAEFLFRQYIENIYKSEILVNKRFLNKKEIDVYLPDLKIAFEYNGLYWHNELNKPNNYHLNKTEECEKMGIQLIHIWEDDWLYKNDIIKSIIKQKIGLTDNKIYARKTKIVILSNKEIRNFLNTNHLQGYVSGNINLGLKYNDELVSLMTFGKKRIFMNSTSIEGEYELLRFCNKLDTTVIGGASKLFNYFIKNYEYKSILTYADRCISKGDLYLNLGFKYIGKSEPNYYYIVDDKRENRFKYRKDILVKNGYDSNLSEHDIMLEREIFRIYNAGNLKFIFEK